MWQPEIPSCIRATGHYPIGMAKNVAQNTRKPDFKEEARMISEFVDRMIKSGEARNYLIKHGFVTKSGKLTKRYGG